MAVSDTQDLGHGPSEPNDNHSCPSDCKDKAYIYTSIRFDPSLNKCVENNAASFNISCPFYMLEHHWTRLQVAKWSAQFWPQGDSVKMHDRPVDFLHGLYRAVKQWQHAHPREAESKECLRVRRLVYPSGGTSTLIWQIPRVPLDGLYPKSFDVAKDTKQIEWTITLDCQPTETNESTMFKTSDRSKHGRARADAGINDQTGTQEVLLFNGELQIIDCSSSTPYLLRNGRWVTPISSAGGLQGTTRRWALEQGLCSEAGVTTASMVEGEVVWLSNAVRGFFPAIFHHRDPALRPASEEQTRMVIQQLP